MRRRAFLEAGGRALAGLVLVPRLVVLRAPKTVAIRMRSDVNGSKVWFDPIGLHLDAGDTVRWVIEANVHTATAYHPANHKPRRIPTAATPWDSGYLVNPGDHFEVTLTAPGVYDYFCLPHEAAGMVGRIVVGRPPFPADALPDDAGEIPAAARSAFPAVADILARGRVTTSRR